MCLFDEIDNGPVVERREIILSKKAMTKVQVILAIILRQQEFNKKYNKPEWVSIHSSVLNLFDGNYKSKIDWLIFNRIIEKDDFYIMGEKTYMYRVIDTNIMRGYKVVGGYPFVNLGNQELGLLWCEKDFLKELNKYKECFQNFKIMQSKYKENALRTIKRAKNNQNTKYIYSFASSKNSILETMRKNGRTEESITIAKRQIENINFDKSRELGYDGNMSRFFDVISSLPREVRKELLVNGNKLIEIDILTCQPQISVNYFKEIGINDTSYFNVVKTGKIYEKLMETDTNLKREQAKVLWAKYMMGNKNNRLRVADKHKDWMDYDLLKKLDNKFHIEFPLIYRYLKNNRENIAIELQYRESFIMNNVFDKLCEKGLNENVIFLHDCIYVIENGNQDRVIDIIQQELRDNDLLVREYKKEEKDERVVCKKENMYAYVSNNIKRDIQLIEKERVRDNYDTIINRFLTETKEKELKFEF
jgi:hypothetical protein